MGLSNSRLEPEELKTFKKLPTTVSLTDIDIPEKIENRRLTNAKWFIVLGVFTLIFVPFMGYTLSYADIKRELVGYDQCGNTCGKVNYRWEGIPCSGQNTTDKPLLQYINADNGRNYDFPSHLKSRVCSETCLESEVLVNGKCVHASINELSKSVDIGFIDYFSATKYHIIVSCLFSIVISIGMLMLFRHAVACIVWFILICSLCALAVFTIFLWYEAIQLSNNFNSRVNANDNSSGVKVVASVFTVLTIVLAIMLVWCRNKVKLLIMLFHETTKAVFDMPGLVLVPVTSCLVNLALMVVFGFLLLALFSSGILTQVNSDYYVYLRNPVMNFTIFYAAFLLLWLVQCVNGTQYMVISGSISNWYFTRDKVLLRNPISRAIAVTFKCHLGTVIFGSFILTVTQIIKSIIQSLCKNEKLACVMEYCLDEIETFFKFLSRNAYIVTGLHGQPFLRSGKRAAKLIMQNIRDVIAINYIGDFVIGMAVLLIMVVSLLVCLLIFFMFPEKQMDGSYNFFGFLIVALVSLLVGSITFGVFEATMETLFVCYCEDLLINNGAEKPFYMSRNLMEFVEESKKVYKKKSRNNL